MSEKSGRRPPRTLTTAELTAKIIDLTSELGACRVGITTVDTLAGGPPSTDLQYVLPGARAAITFALPFDQDKIRDYLSKRDRDGHQVDYSRTNTLATGVAAQLAGYIAHFGHPSVGTLSNEVYRNDDANRPSQLYPDISHRLLAVRGGVGWFGLSGNVMTPDHGANVSLATAVTTAELEPTEPLLEKDNYCDECGDMECVAACPSAFLHNAKKQQTTVTMGGVSFTYAERRNYDRCGYVCAGYSGLHPSGRWSTWSPGRFPIPKHDGDLRAVVPDALKAWVERPKLDGHTLQQPLLYQATRKDVQLTCGSCMLVCAADPEERRRRLEMLRGHGVVVQHPDGRVEAMSPEAARAHLDAMDPETRALYEPEDPDAYDDLDTYGS
ncbi:MAG: epoxyqueuosine reductase [Alphaproteobacteria bacterium]|jgi:epoxyqueuosine reductase QueG|nr:epoxyqueuosine reductase [Alphaproteobacteria bacterium]MDP6566718.1 epoxyqueuosine reductase [Alphaproteobacteria bacterium]MDP6814225.1 epoxyqueuosine reductase [Alphaproteobacteria bacterium]